MSLAAQAKLLRVVEDKQLTRLGDPRLRKIDVRIVAATNRDLEQWVREGRFREDLYYRLVAATLVLLPLRDRPREIPLLARAFVRAECKRRGIPERQLSSATIERLLTYRWKGNIRELKNTMEMLVAMVQDPTIELWHLPPKLRGDAAPRNQLEGPRIPGVAVAEQKPDVGAATTDFLPIAEELAALEKKRMLEALEATKGVIARAAKRIGMPERTFYKKMREYDIHI